MEKIPFDEKASNVEDRIWGKKLSLKDIRYFMNQKLKRFSLHGVHQNLDPIRASNVVGIIENLDQNLYTNDPQKVENLNIVAIFLLKEKY